MRHLILAEVVELLRRLLQVTGGGTGIRDLGALEAAIAQPKATFGGADLYPTLVEKATALCFSLIQGIRSWTATSACGTQRWTRSLTGSRRALLTRPPTVPDSGRFDA